MLSTEFVALVLNATGLFFLVLWAHSLTRRFGPAHFFALLGGLTVLMSWVTDAGVSISVGGIVFVVGSTVFYTALLLGVFVVYVFDGPAHTRIAISTVLAMSILTPVIGAVLHLQTRLMGGDGLPQIPTPDLRINAASAAVTLIDLVFLAVAWEILGKPGLRLKLWLRSFATLLGVMGLDVVLFATAAFAGTPRYLGIMGGTIISRLVVSLVAFPCLYIYLEWQSRRNKERIENRPVLAILQRVAEAENELLIVREEAKKRRETEAALRRSQELLDATARVARVGGWELDVESAEVSWTDETYRIHETPPGRAPSLDEAIGFVDPEDREPLENAIRRAVDHCESYDMELRLITAKGKKIWVRTIGSPAQSGGKVTRLTGTIQDITDRKTPELELLHYREELKEKVATRTAQLSDAKQQWESTFDAISDWVAIVAEDHTIIRSNMASVQFTGFHPKEIVGKHCHEVYHETMYRVPGCPLERAIADQAPASLEFQDKRGRWFSVSVDPIEQDEGGRRFVHVVREITELKQREDDLLMARKAEAFSVLSGGIAHDYNNLLSVIWANVSLLAQEVSGEMAGELLREADAACEQARALTHQFITLSRGATLRIVAVEVEPFLRNLVRQSREVRDLDVSIETAPDLPVVDMDPELMGIAIRNIITNAAEAMPDGGRLAIRAELDVLEHPVAKASRGLKLIFEDHGRGIDRSDLLNVFDPYFSTKEMGSRKGMGLGLAVAQSIAMKHGGQIRIDSTAARGTTVTLEMPLPVSRRETRSVDSVVRRSAAFTVMLLEDNPSISRICQRILEKLDCKVVATSEGNEAIETYTNLARSGVTIDLVLLDQNIPGGKGGVETLESLRSLGYTKPAIVVTGSPNSPAILDYEKFGFDGNLLKPYTMDELKAVLEQHLPLEKTSYLQV